MIKTDTLSIIKAGYENKLKSFQVSYITYAFEHINYPHWDICPVLAIPIRNLTKNIATPPSAKPCFPWGFRPEKCQQYHQRC